MIVKKLKALGKKSLAEIDPLSLQLKNPDLSTAQRRALAAKINGVHRRYKRDVLVEVTAWALETDNSQASKHKVEKWQEASFGRSVSNNTLATTWCDANRGAGERADLDISEATTAKAQELFALFDGALKAEINASRLKALSGSLLDDALGL
jgi:hypothetical protein